MRSYSGLILFENIFDFLPEGDVDFENFARSVFEPGVAIVTDDCGTSLGKVIDTTFEIEGHIELATGQPLSQDRIAQLLFLGQYQTSVRSLSTCIARGGVCRACYHASRQKEPIPEVDTLVHIKPEYETSTELITIPNRGKVIQLSFEEDEYDYIYVYTDGRLLPDSEYSISGATLTLNTAVQQDTTFTLRYTTVTRAPFVAHLAETYAGSLLGMKALPSPKLPIRYSLLASLIPESRLELLVEQSSSHPNIPEVQKNYLTRVQDPVEKALYAIALSSIFSNVNV